MEGATHDSDGMNVPTLGKQSKGDLHVFEKVAMRLLHYTDDSEWSVGVLAMTFQCQEQTVRGVLDTEDKIFDQLTTRLEELYL